MANSFNFVTVYNGKTNLGTLCDLILLTIYDKRGLAKERLGDKLGACYDFRKVCKSGSCKNLERICNDNKPTSKTNPLLNLVETTWKAETINIDEKETGDSLELNFIYGFAEKGEATVVVFSTRRGLYHEYVDDSYGGTRLVLKSSVKSKFSTTEKGTYTQNGNSIHLEFPSQKVDAEISDDFANGTIFLPDWGRKDGLQWKAQKQSK